MTHDRRCSWCEVGPYSVPHFFLQGYLFSPAMPVDVALARMLRSYNEQRTTDDRPQTNMRYEKLTF